MVRTGSESLSRSQVLEWSGKRPRAVLSLKPFGSPSVTPGHFEDAKCLKWQEILAR